MIVGSVNPFRDPVIRLTLIAPDGRREEIEAVVDTGFNGTLSLPPDLIRSLALPFLHSGRAILADGSETLFDIFEAPFSGTTKYAASPWTKRIPNRSLVCR